MIKTKLCKTSNNKLSLPIDGKVYIYIGKIVRLIYPPFMDLKAVTVMLVPEHEGRLIENIMQ